MPTNAPAPLASPQGKLRALEKTAIRRPAWRRPPGEADSAMPKQLVDADSRCKLAAWASADARGLDQIHRKVLYLCTLPKRKTSIRGSAGLQRLKFCVLQRKRRQRLLNEAVSEHGLSHGVGL
jgi:hypothetical protein